MGLRRVYASARVSLCVAAAVAALSGCAGHPDAIAGATASLRATLSELGQAAAIDDAQRAREDAIIAQAIAAHEMRNP